MAENGPSVFPFIVIVFIVSRSPDSPFISTIYSGDMKISLNSD